MWLAIVGVGIGSYLLRVIPLVVLPRVSVPPAFDRVVRHAGLAAITALLVASITGRASGELAPTVIAVVVASVLAIRRVSMVIVVSVGGLVYAASLLATSAVA